jgi:hypothetical protein
VFESLESLLVIIVMVWWAVTLSYPNKLVSITRNPIMVALETGYQHAMG